jgi:NADH:ubiquinone oxidoreductase subunit 2 (subunit N)
VLDFLVVVPFLILMIGAIVVALVADKIPEPSRRWLTVGILTSAFAGILINMAPSTHYFAISTWDAASFSIALQFDGISFVLLVAIFLPLIALQLARPAASLDSFAFYVLAAAILLTCAGNLITMLFAWAFLDLALFAWRESRRIPHDLAMRALILGQLAGLALFAGTILLGAKQTETGALLIALAFWARLGLFPFHWVYPNADLQTLELVAIRGAALAAGASLWLHWNDLGTGLPSGLIASLASVAFIVVIVRLASDPESMDKIATNATNAIAFVPLAVAFNEDAAVALGFWIALSVILALAMFELALMWQPDFQNRWSRLFFIIGIFSIAGIPLTPAFLGRVGAGVALAENGQWLIILISSIALAYALVPLWQIGLRLRGNDLREPTGVEYIGLQLLGLAFVVMSLASTVLAQAIEQSDSAQAALDLVVRTTDFGGVGIGFFALLAPLVISFGAARVDWGYRAELANVAQWAGRVLDLDWLARWIARMGEGISALASGLAALAEENPTVWILLVALWIAIFILTTH